MITIKRLTNEEANAIDEITRVYKLPFMILTKEDDRHIYRGDYIYDAEEDIQLSLFDGILQIIDVINCDDRELFNTIDTETTKTFAKLCKELNLN